MLNAGAYWETESVACLRCIAPDDIFQFRKLQTKKTKHGYHVFTIPCTLAKTLRESIVSVSIRTENNSPGFLIAKFFGDHFAQLESQSVRDLLRQIRMRTAAKNLYIWHSWLIRGAYSGGAVQCFLQNTVSEILF